MVGTQQCQEKRQQGKNKEKKDRGRGRNHPSQRRQLMRVWEKYKRTGKRRKNKKKKQEMGDNGAVLQEQQTTGIYHPLSQSLKVNEFLV